MANLITIKTTEDGQAVSARELHLVLGIQKDFTDWFKYQAERAGLTEGSDFSPILGESTGGRPATDYVLSLDTAKHIAMMSGGEKAHMLRDYFIELEKAWNSPEMVMSRALKMADKKLLSLEGAIADLQSTIEEQKPKVLFADSVTTSNTSILIGELAKIIKQNGYDIGEKRLFKWLRAKGYLISRRGTDFNAPTQKSMELGLFSVKETAITHADGHVTISKTTKVTGKGQVYFINKFIGAVGGCYAQAKGIQATT